MRYVSHLIAVVLGAGVGILAAVYVVLLHDQDKPKRQRWLTTDPWR